MSHPLHPPRALGPAVSRRGSEDPAGRPFPLGFPFAGCCILVSILSPCVCPPVGAR